MIGFKPIPMKAKEAIIDFNNNSLLINQYDYINKLRSEKIKLLIISLSTTLTSVSLIIYMAFKSFNLDPTTFKLN